MPTAFRPDWRFRPGLELPVEGSATGLVWRTQQPLMVENLDDERRFPLTVPAMRENGIQSLCAVPLTSALRRLGTPGFGSLTRRKYEEAELHFMQQVANHARWPSTTCCTRKAPSPRGSS